MSATEEKDWLKVTDIPPEEGDEEAPAPRKARGRRKVRVEDSDRLRVGADGAEAVVEGTDSEASEGDVGRAVGGVGATFDPDFHCPGCQRTHAPSLVIQAMRVLKRASALWRKTKSGEAGDRARAFEAYADYLMDNVHILVGSRIIGLDQHNKMVRETHQMLGAPKKKAEAGVELPMDRLQNWMNS